MLPAEAEICASLDVKRITLRHALKLLADEKLIQKQRGKGTIVNPKNDWRLSAESGTLGILISEAKMEAYYAEVFAEIIRIAVNSGMEISVLNASVGGGRQVKERDQSGEN